LLARWAPGGRLNRVLRLTMRDGKIAEFEIVADPARPESLEIAVLPD
jgi:RNA polymerase sigma-70 factor (ECF subfamily)